MAALLYAIMFHRNPIADLPACHSYLYIRMENFFGITGDARQLCFIGPDGTLYLMALANQLLGLLAALLQ